MKKLFFLPLLVSSLFFISCEEDDHDDHGCHECHLELQMADGTIDHSYEIGEFCGDALSDVEANGFVTEAFDHMGETFSAGTYTNVHCEEHADH